MHSKYQFWETAENDKSQNLVNARKWCNLLQIVDSTLEINPRSLAQWG
jgi:hypothetical protein